jgi:hypothetical protein
MDAIKELSNYYTVPYYQFLVGNTRKYNSSTFIPNIILIVPVGTVVEENERRRKSKKKNQQYEPTTQQPKKPPPK